MRRFTALLACFALLFLAVTVTAPPSHDPPAVAIAGTVSERAAGAMLEVVLPRAAYAQERLASPAAPQEEQSGIPRPVLIAAIIVGAAIVLYVVFGDRSQSTPTLTGGGGSSGTGRRRPDGSGPAVT